MKFRIQKTHVKPLFHDPTRLEPTSPTDVPLMSALSLLWLVLDRPKLKSAPSDIPLNALSIASVEYASELKVTSNPLVVVLRALCVV